MRKKRLPRRGCLRVEELESRVSPTVSPWLQDSFAAPTTQWPAGWSQWSNDGRSSFAPTSNLALSPPSALAATTVLSTSSTRAWFNTTLLPDVQDSASIHLDSLNPAQVFARGNNLGSPTPTYYAVEVTTGMRLQLLRVVNGTRTNLGAAVTSQTYSNIFWAQVTLDVEGSTIEAAVHRLDTNQYLDSSGVWQNYATWTVAVTDYTITGQGFAGLARPSGYAGTTMFDDFQIAFPRASDSFDTTAVGTLPSGWAQGNNNGSVFAVASSRVNTPPHELQSASDLSSASGQTWNTAVQLRDARVSAAVYLDSLIPAQVFARGSNLGGGTPTYYAAQVIRGTTVSLVKVLDGTSTTLGTLASAAFTQNIWVKVTLDVEGSTVQVQVYRPDKNQYLSAGGVWQTAQAWALTRTDTSISGTGYAGLARAAQFAGSVAFDDFTILPATPDYLPPAVTITAPTVNATLSGTVTVKATATDNVSVARVEFSVDGVWEASLPTATAYSWIFDTRTVWDGTHTLTVKAYDGAGNVNVASTTVTTANHLALPQPTLPAPYPNLRVADLAYLPWKPGTFEAQQLGQSVSLVVSDPNSPSNIDLVSTVAPNTPQLIYTNISNIYGDSLTDWLAYADANGIDREAAFFHAQQPTPFADGNASTQPVSRFWGVYLRGTSWTNLTSAASSTATNDVPFGAAGGALYVGYTEKFREIDITVGTAAAGGWRAALEYPTAVDSQGVPTIWATLTTLSNTTNGLEQSGQILFDPPANWVAASIDGSARLLYVRFRTIAAPAGAIIPVASTILGTNYVSNGLIPAFDYAADTNHDGYLSDAEYAHHAPGKTARFAYQSRIFDYGQMRFYTNVGNAAFQNWLAGYNLRYLNSFPLAAGLFVDNSLPVLPTALTNVVEPGVTQAWYASTMGTAFKVLDHAIAPRWTMANTSDYDQLIPGTSSYTADAVIQNSQLYFQEYGLQPLFNDTADFEAAANLLTHRAGLTASGPIGVLDASPNSNPAGRGSKDITTAAGQRTFLAELAEYYLLANPGTNLLDFNGGADPGTAWVNHWTQAAAYNIGQPTGGWWVYASGPDPENPSLTYKVYARNYTNALVLYRPLSYRAAPFARGTIDDATATTFDLGGSYRPLQALDGSLGAVLTAITLRNGEGAILIPVVAGAASVPASTTKTTTTTSTSASTPVTQAVVSAGTMVSASPAVGATSLSGRGLTLVKTEVSFLTSSLGPGAAIPATGPRATSLSQQLQQWTASLSSPDSVSVWGVLTTVAVEHGDRVANLGTQAPTVDAIAKLFGMLFRENAFAGTI